MSNNKASLAYNVFTRREAIASPSTWRDCKAHFEGLHEAGYNFAESEPIWVKFGTLLAKCWGWPWQTLGAIRAVATV